MDQMGRTDGRTDRHQPRSRPPCLFLTGLDRAPISPLNPPVRLCGALAPQILGTPNHAGPVTGLDVCVRKALIASCCSSDRSVRLWNWVDRTCELHRTFADEIFSIAIHPTGLMVLVGFADKLRLMSVLMEDLKTIKELGIKGCRECCFSTGGQ
jgi:hypothetical protein